MTELAERFEALRPRLLRLALDALRSARVRREAYGRIDIQRNPEKLRRLP